MSTLMIGNEAVALGALDAGVALLSSYPGTPSTEITEFAAKDRSRHIEWAPNEKVAAETAVGAAIGGARAMCCMKHVGLNVAADPIFTAAYTGVRAGLVIVVADDPGMHSSQNEQDSRYYAMSAHIPMLEPASSQECYDFCRRAFEISEQYDTPVFLRLTTRIAHSQGLVERAAAHGPVLIPYKKETAKYTMMPGFARARHLEVEKREKRLAADCNTFSDINRILPGGKTGIICSGAVYRYAAAALPDASFLKIGMCYPLPDELIRSFAAGVDDLIIAEELEPIIQQHVRALGIPCRGKELFTIQGEYSASMIAAALGRPVPEYDQTDALPARPPVLCPGCPHRAVFYTLGKMKLTVMGDIGCYTLGAAAPLNAIDACVCMGAGISMAHGLDRSGAVDPARTVAVIGDSTFLHSGITGLMNIVYNKGRSTVIILDNSITGMTGHQQNPATGKDIRGDAAPAVNLEQLCRALGVSDVKTVDPFDMPALREALLASLAFDGPSVIIARRPCALLSKARTAPLRVTQSCIGCRRCMGIACPALIFEAGRARVDISLCNGCGLCASVCPKGAIVKEEM